MADSSNNNNNIEINGNAGGENNGDNDNSNNNNMHSSLRAWLEAETTPAGRERLLQDAPLYVEAARAAVRNLGHTDKDQIAQEIRDWVTGLDHGNDGAASAPADNPADESVDPALQDPLKAEPLSYPHDFFNTKSGLGPKDATQAAALWPYRKQRPASGSVDPDEPADGVKMLAEVQSMRNRLKSHIENAFMKDARLMAGFWNLKVPKTNQTPHTTKDFVRALGALERVEGSLENERIVYMVCHHFHHQRQWLSDAVDAWCHEENIKIEFPPHPVVVGGVSKRSSPSNRGGFGVCARNVKVEMVKQLMRNMLCKAGWCIATKDNSKQNSKQGQAKRYEAICIRIPQTFIDHTCYVVTKEGSAKKAPGKNKDGGLATMGSSADAIDVDKIGVGFGAHLCSTLGVAMSTERLQDIWKTYQPPGNVVGLQISTEDGNAGEDISSLGLQIVAENKTPGGDTRRVESEGESPPSKRRKPDSSRFTAASNEDAKRSDSEDDESDRKPAARE